MPPRTLPAGRAILTSTPIQLLKDLVEYFDLSEASGDRVGSVAGTLLSPHGTSLPGNVTAQNGNGAQLIKAQAQYLDAPDSAVLSMGDIDFTVAIWVWLDTNAATMHVFGKGSGSWAEYQLIYTPPGVDKFTFRVDKFNVISTTVSPPNGSAGLTGRWHLVVGWHDSVANTINIQVDNGQVYSAAHSLGSYNGADPLVVGKSIQGAFSYWDGRQQGLGIWKRVLTAAERSAYWNGGRGLRYPFDGAGQALTIASPVSFQVVQRSGTTGSIPISGVGTGALVEARFNGGAWATIATNVSGTFSGTLTGQAQGWGSVDVRIDGGTPVSVPQVGIGDVYVIAGQSNATGHGTNLQVAPTSQAGEYSNAYTYQRLHDPVDSETGQVDAVSNDAVLGGTGGAAGGTYWLGLATSIITNKGVPIAFVPCSLGGTGILSWQPGANHQDRTTLYGSMVYRALQAGGIKAVLWHQGESDAQITTATPRATYASRLDTLATNIYTDLGVDTIVARIHLWTGAPTTDAAHVAAINGGMADAAGTNAHVLLGPDFSSPNLTTSLHFGTDAELADAAARWYAVLQPLYYP